MPCFFFDLTRNGIHDPDKDGTELPDAETAQREAVRTVGEMMRGSSVHGPVRNLSMIVLDQDRNPIARCDFSITASR